MCDVIATVSVMSSCMVLVNALISTIYHCIYIYTNHCIYTGYDTMIDSIKTFVGIIQNTILVLLHSNTKARVDFPNLTGPSPESTNIFVFMR